MAEDFQASSWWKTSRSGSGGGGGFENYSPATSTVSCSTTVTDVTGVPFPWSAGTSTDRPLLDSTLQLSGFGLPSPTLDWSQTLLNSGGRAESNFQAILQEDLNSRSSFSVAMNVGEPSNVPLRDINHPFFFENSLISGSAFPLACSSSSTSLMQGLLEPDSRAEQPLFDSQQIVQYQQSQMMQQKQQSPMINHLQFTNNTPFWNASSSSQPFDQPMKSSDVGSERKSSNEPTMKKIRVETPSPLPTFKVRKEKLGDRITALQQLVSPFGKTDTASVLHEAIEYIKFLHDQVSVLSTPYLKNGHPMQQQKQDGEEQKQDLRSRGLCLVPIASTYPVATETNADFWTPSFGGSYR